MPLVPAICTQCGAPIEVDSTKEAGICPHCGTAFITEKAITQYVTNHVTNTNVTQNITKIIQGREKDEAEDFVLRGLSFLSLEDYLEAAKCFEKAVKLSPADAENHILLYKAITFDFKFYYGALTTKDGGRFTFPLDGNDYEGIPLNDVFAKIEKLAEKTDISALREKYGYSFRRDKEFWKNCFVFAEEALQGKHKDVEKLAKKYYGSLGFRKFDDVAAAAFEALMTSPGLSEEEKEECRNLYFTYEYDKNSDTLRVISFRCFPEKDGYFDTTSVKCRLSYYFPYGSNNTYADVLLNDFHLRGLTRENFRLFRDVKLRAPSPVWDLTGVFLEGRTLTFEEGVRETGIGDGVGNIQFNRFVFPDSLEKITSLSGIWVFSVDLDFLDTSNTLRFGKNLKYIGDRAFFFTQRAVFSGAYILPEGLQHIGTQAFYGSGDLTKAMFVLPASVRSTGEKCFDFEKGPQLVCVGNLSSWNKKWNWLSGYDSNSKSTKWKPYAYFYLKANAFYYNDLAVFVSERGEVVCFDPAKSDSEERRAFLQNFKQFGDFDENKTKFYLSMYRTEGCYIATAVYKSYDCPQVWTLRRFRDEKLKKSAGGRLFVRIYYALSPTLVRLFGKQKWFCFIWKKILDAKVKKLNKQGYADTPYAD